MTPPAASTSAQRRGLSSSSSPTIRINRRVSSQASPNPFIESEEEISDSNDEVIDDSSDETEAEGVDRNEDVPWERNFNHVGVGNRRSDINPGSFSTT